MLAVMLASIFTSQKLSEEEIERLLVKRCLTLPGRVGRWKGSFQWTTHMVKMEKMAAMEKKYNAIMNRYWISPDYYGSPVTTSTDGSVVQAFEEVWRRVRYGIFLAAGDS